MSIEDIALAEAIGFQRNHPSLTAHDWRVLGSIIDAGPQGLAYTAIRADAEWFGTTRKHLPSLERLIEADLIEKIGSKGRPVCYQRTTKPLVATSPPAPAQPAPSFVL